MKFHDVKHRVKAAFEEAGILFDSSDLDPDIVAYIEDSVQYVSSIVAIENALQIEIPDVYLVPDTMHSLNEFCRALKEIMDNQDDR